jgi:hypothetical protein
MRAGESRGDRGDTRTAEERPAEMSAVAEVRERRDPAVLLGALTLVLVALLLSSAIVVTYVAFGRQASRVSKLERADEALTARLTAAEATLGEHAQGINRATKLARNSYQRGYVAGKRAQLLPQRFSMLENFATAGFLVPRSVPPELRSQQFVAEKFRRGYALRWRRSGVALFASAGEPLRVWTRQAWPGSMRTVIVGPRTVTRLVAPSGIVHAWREDGRTYAVLTLRETEALAAPLITAMR